MCIRDSYRRESRKILKIFKEHCDLVEKASVDEVFLDLGRLCFQDLMFGENEEFESCDQLKMLRKMFIEGDYDLKSRLPVVPDDLKKLEFVGNVFNSENRCLIEDWDDIIFLLASRRTQAVRDVIFKNLGYTTSCGISRTKNVCKLGSNFKKPNAQTTIKNNCLEDFLDSGKFEITSFWTMGGKLGQDISEILNVPSEGSLKYIRESWPNSAVDLEHFIEQKVKELEKNGSTTRIDMSKVDELSTKIYKLARGIYCVPLNPRPVVKSMMSNKNMRKDGCTSLIDCIDWLEVFSAELIARITELEQEYNKIIIPRTISIFVKTHLDDVARKSTQLIHRDSKINSQQLLKMGTQLITELDAKFARGNSAKFYPLLNMNMIISNFEIIDQKKTVIDMFGQQAQIFQKNTANKEPELTVQGTDDADTNAARTFNCHLCSLEFDSEREFQEHLDFHVASKLSESLNGFNGDSKNLSEGEKRLLFPTKRKTASQGLTAGKNKKKKTNSKVGNILSFFGK